MLPAVLFPSKYTWLQFHLFFKIFIVVYISIFYSRLPVNNGWPTSCDRRITFSENKTYSYEIKTKTKLRGLSPRANYTDRAAAAGRRS
jgi:hypothetical protein